MNIGYFGHYAVLSDPCGKFYWWNQLMAVSRCRLPLASVRLFAYPFCLFPDRLYILLPLFSL